MYTDTALKLVQDAKRLQALDVLPSYATDLVHAVVREIRDLQRDASLLIEQQGPDFRASLDRRVSCAIFVLQICMRRNKRCLLAYHAARARRLDAIAWTGVELPTRSDDDNAPPLVAEETPLDAATAATRGIAAGWNPHEDEYFRAYYDTLTELKGEWTDIDLVGPMEPPTDLFIDVRVLKDAGEIQTEYGAITLTKNSQFYIRHGDVERLIQQGYLQRLS
ncbi:uncharacterized protein V1518DRAFT_368996 [Limtongia smithiae]|uniref:uncharacterized protein n=1 Tax=Limtongia smithiae TaxID=1125753 RepID=UPI0034CE2A10